MWRRVFLLVFTNVKEKYVAPVWVEWRQNFSLPLWTLIELHGASSQKVVTVVRTESDRLGGVGYVRVRYIVWMREQEMHTIYWWVNLQKWGYFENFGLRPVTAFSVRGIEPWVQYHECLRILMEFRSPDFFLIWKSHLWNSTSKENRILFTDSLKHVEPG
jgi:hypothetical protein